MIKAFVRRASTHLLETGWRARRGENARHANIMRIAAEGRGCVRIVQIGLALSERSDRANKVGASWGSDWFLVFVPDTKELPAIWLWRSDCSVVVFYGVGKSDLTLLLGVISKTEWIQGSWWWFYWGVRTIMLGVGHDDFGNWISPKLVGWGGEIMEMWREK